MAEPAAKQLGILIPCLKVLYSIQAKAGAQKSVLYVYCCQNKLHRGGQTIGKRSENANVAKTNKQNQCFQNLGLYSLNLPKQHVHS